MATPLQGLVSNKKFETFDVLEDVAKLVPFKYIKSCFTVWLSNFDDHYLLILMFQLKWMTPQARSFNHDRVNIKAYLSIKIDLINLYSVVVFFWLYLHFCVFLS